MLYTCSTFAHVASSQILCFHLAGVYSNVRDVLHFPKNMVFFVSIEAFQILHTPCPASPNFKNSHFNSCYMYVLFFELRSYLSAFDLYLGFSFELLRIRHFSRTSPITSIQPSRLETSSHLPEKVGQLGGFDVGVRVVPSSVPVYPDDSQLLNSAQISDLGPQINNNFGPEIVKNDIDNDCTCG